MLPLGRGGQDDASATAFHQVGSEGPNGLCFLDLVAEEVASTRSKSLFVWHAFHSLQAIEEGFVEHVRRLDLRRMAKIGEFDQMCVGYAPLPPCPEPDSCPMSVEWTAAPGFCRLLSTTVPGNSLPARIFPLLTRIH
jgi:hypothetical protein